MLLCRNGIQSSSSVARGRRSSTTSAGLGSRLRIQAQASRTPACHRNQTSSRLYPRKMPMSVQIGIYSGRVADPMFRTPQKNQNATATLTRYNIVCLGLVSTDLRQSLPNLTWREFSPFWYSSRQKSRYSVSKSYIFWPSQSPFASRCSKERTYEDDFQSHPWYFWEAIPITMTNNASTVIAPNMSTIKSNGEAWLVIDLIYSCKSQQQLQSWSQQQTQLLDSVDNGPAWSGTSVSSTTVTVRFLRLQT